MSSSSSSSLLSSLKQAATDAVANHPKSHIEMGMDFVEKACPAFLSADNDRLLKVGRSLENLVALQDKIPLEESLGPLVQECELLASNKVKVPKCRFGKTEIQMPIVTLGCMRFQRAWGDTIQSMDQVGSDCQDNLVAILKRAIVDFGINHIETARGYGCSELQLGVALKQLFKTGVVKRKDLILQTKVRSMATAQEFRETLEKSFSRLQVDYIDLFSFHGLNEPHQYNWVFDNGDKGNCMDVVKEYVAAGKIRHVGFSTHGHENVIRRFIETDAFEYVNLHYHYFGSYTTTGVGTHAGNLGNMRLLKEKDMGVFIISPYDKGGKLYEPSNKLRCLTLPDMEPMAFGSHWLWSHADLDETKAGAHTIVCGAARPADLDQPAVAAYLQGADETRTKLESVVARLEAAAKAAHEGDWLATCYEGVPKSDASKHAVEHNQIIWCFNLIHSYGLLSFAKNRYGSLQNNREKWDDSRTREENIQKVGPIGWGFVPGLSLEPGKDYHEDDLTGVPEPNKERVRKAEAFVHKWCGKRQKTTKQEGGEEKKDEEGKEEELTPPLEWQTAYEMKPWVDWPERPL